MKPPGSPTTRGPAPWSAPSPRAASPALALGNGPCGTPVQRRAAVPRRPPAKCDGRSFRFELALLVQQGDAIGRQDLVDVGLILDDQPVEFAFPVLITVAHTHGD